MGAMKLSPERLIAPMGRSYDDQRPIVVPQHAGNGSNVDVRIRRVRDPGRC